MDIREKTTFSARSGVASTEPRNHLLRQKRIDSGRPGDPDGKEGKGEKVRTAPKARLSPKQGYHFLGRDL